MADLSTPDSILGVSGPQTPVGPFGLQFPQQVGASGPAPAAAPATPAATPPGTSNSAPAAPAGGAASATAGAQTPTGNPTQSNPYALAQVMTALQNQITNNNQLVTAKNLVMKQLYDVPLSDADKAQLQQTSPALAAALASGDRNLIDFNLRLLNDQIAGRTNTLDQSVSTLTSGYNTAAQQLETQKQDAISNVQNFVTQYGSNAGAALQALYGPDYVNQLAQMGINLPGFESATGQLPTINQQRYSAQYGITSGSGAVGGYDLSSYATNPNYASEVSSIASTIGPVTDPTSAQTAISQIAPGSPITGQMVMDAANQYGVDPTVLMSVMQADTKMGTDGSFGSKVNNFGDVGVNDTLAAKINAGTATPAEIASVSMTPQGGVDAVASWLKDHPANTSNAEAIAKAIESGQQPPVTTGLYGQAANVKGQLAKDGYDLSAASEDWTATQTWLSTANSAQQLRLRQAINFAGDSLDVIGQMNDAWDGSNFPVYNKASLLAAEQGVGNAPLPQPLTISVPGSDGSTQSVTIKDKQTLANLLNAQISDLTSEMGTVYKGGYSSTDDSLALAAKNLSADWSYDTLQSALELAKTNLQIRSNSISTTGPVTGGQSNPYAPGAGTSGASGAQSGASAPSTTNNQPQQMNLNGKILNLQPDGTYQ